jgi:hypothetical protein
MIINRILSQVPNFSSKNKEMNAESGELPLLRFVTRKSLANTSQPKQLGACCGDYKIGFVLKP